MIAISGNPVPYNQFYSVIRGRMFLAMLRIPESCLAVAIEMICVSHLRPCLELNNTTHNGIDVFIVKNQKQKKKTIPNRNGCVSPSTLLGIV